MLTNKFKRGKPKVSVFRFPINLNIRITYPFYNMELVMSLGQDPEKIDDPDLIRRILKTLDYLRDKTGIEYIFAKVQSPSIGGSCYPRPKNHVPTSERDIVLGKYDITYFEQKREYLTRKS